MTTVRVHDNLSLSLVFHSYCVELYGWSPLSEAQANISVYLCTSVCVNKVVRTTTVSL